MPTAAVLRGVDLHASRTVLDGLTDATVLLDSRGRVAHANPAALKLTHAGLDELVGAEVGHLIAGPDHGRHSLFAGRNARPDTASPGREHMELTMLRQDGTEFPADVSITRLGDPFRDTFLMVARPIHADAVAGPEEVERLRQMAEFRARFLNIAAHELKTPLTPIRIQLQILQTYLADAPEQVTRSMGILSRSVDRLNALMEDVLDAARIQASRLKLRMEPVSMTGLVNEAIESYAAVGKAVGVSLQSDVRPDVVVVGDRVRLVQILNNLLSNGIKFTPPGGHLDVGLERRGDRAVLRVHDTGRGMTQEQLVQLFQPFMQVHPDLEATRKGTGLGLYITKSIVEQHNGTIEIMSKGPGKGTQVTIRLPLSREKPLPEPERMVPRKGQLQERLRELV